MGVNDLVNVLRIATGFSYHLRIRRLVSLHAAERLSKRTEEPCHFATLECLRDRLVNRKRRERNEPR
jgi:hypothetical protein